MNESGQKSTATQSGRFGAGTLIGAMLLGLFGFGLWLFAPQIIRIATNQGELVIETDDENVKVTISQDGETVRVLDSDSGASFDIRSGEFTISAMGKDGKTEFQVQPNKLTMQRGAREVVQVTRIEKTTPPSPISLADGSQNESTSKPEISSATNDLAKLRYNGKQLSEWLNILEIDRNPQSQAEALKACAALYASSGHADDLMAVLQSYLQRNTANQQLYQGNDQAACFSGFSESLKVLPPQKIVEFFKLQLKQGNASTINWSYRGMLNTRQNSRERSYTRPFSNALRNQLQANSAELLLSLAARDDCNSLSYLLDFFAKRAIKDPVSNETRGAILAVLAKFDSENLFRSADSIPKRLLTPELFAPVKSQLFAADTPATERDELIEGLIRVQQEADDPFLLGIFAEVIANQMYDPDRIEFKRLDEMTVALRTNAEFEYSSTYAHSGGPVRKLSGSKVVVRKLLSVICEQIVNRKTAQPEKVAKKILVILSKPSSSDQIAEGELFQPLQIYHDLEALKKLSQKLSGKFGDFIHPNSPRYRKFQGDPEAIKARLFAADTKATERDELLESLIKITRTADGEASSNLEIFAEVMANQMYAPDKIKFYDLQKMIVRQLSKSNELRPCSRSNYKNAFEISGTAVVARRLLTEIADGLLDMETVRRTKYAEVIVAILAKPSDQNTDPTELELFQKLKITQDLEALKKLSQKQSGTFSDFVSSKKRIFEGDPEVAPIAETSKPASPNLKASGDANQHGDQAIDLKTNDKAQILYRGKKISEWLQVLETDLDAKTQAEALRACAAIYSSAGQEDELVALFQAYMQRNKNPSSDDEKKASFSGFKDSLRKLPAEKIAEFFKQQLKQGTPESIQMTLQAMTDSPAFSSPYSSELRKVLKADSVELLRLIAARNQDDGYPWALMFVVRQTLSDPVPDEAVELIKAILAKQDLNFYQLFEIAKRGPRSLLTPDFFASAKAKLFAADTPANERAQLLQRFMNAASSDSLFLLDTLAEVIANQMYASDKLDFSYMQKMDVGVRNGEYYKTTASSTGYLKTIDSNAVVVRKVLTEICFQLNSKGTASPVKVANKVLGILSKPSAGKQKVDPTNFEYFDELDINHDLEALKKFANKQSGKFSPFCVHHTRGFRFKRKVEPATEPKTTDASPSAKTNHDNQQPAFDKDEQPSANDSAKQGMDRGGDSVDLSKLIYRDKKLSEWLKVLESDQDPKTQAEAIKACATLYESIGQDDTIVALLKSFVKRHATNKNSLQDADQLAGFLGFGEVLEKLPPKTVVDFFKYQLKQGDEITIGWAYLAMLKPRDPRKISIFTKLQAYSPELDKELKANAIELLHLIAARDRVDPYDYLLDFTIKNLLKDPVSDDAITAIRELVVKFEPKVLLKVANWVPDHVLDEQLFASVRTRVFAADTKATERDELIEGLIKTEKRAKGKATFILETLAEVIANQTFASNKIEFNEFQRMKVWGAKDPSKNGKGFRLPGFFMSDAFKKLEIKGNAVVARKLLSHICQRLLDKDVASPEAIAKKVLAIQLKASSEKTADLTKPENYDKLKIDFDLKELRKLSEKQSGKFSDFIRGKKEF